MALEHNRRVAEVAQPKERVPVPDWQKPVENFNPQKPETLRPGHVKGRETEERVFEFDVKI